LLPAIATAALGAALLVPLRDARRGKRATLAGDDRPLWPDFRAVTQLSPMAEPSVTAESPQVPVAPDWRSCVRVLQAQVWNFLGAALTPDEPLPDADFQEAHVVERSFALELAALVAAPDSSEGASATVLQPELGGEPIVLELPVTRTPIAAVPLTRMPLRRRSDTITWPASAGASGELGRPARHALLARVINAGDADLDKTLLIAYREEDAEGRLLALRALARGDSSQIRNVLVDALHVGSDEERSFAVDALLAANQNMEVTHAFSDRLDAIAAQAALGYVGTRRRADYVAVLKAFVDQPRIDAILDLLAGVVE
jgi:hypothetical protein